MIGSGLVRNLSKDIEIACTFHKNSYPIKNSFKLYPNVNALDFFTIEKVFKDFLPDVVINAIGVVKQKLEIKAKYHTINLNAMFPHRLQSLCELVGSRLILLSTDCVFSGEKGDYREDDIPDANDIYGRTKIIGEITDSKNVLTIRSSTIGLELGGSKKGLLEWFLSQKGVIYGYDNAIYSGFTIIEFSRIISNILLNFKDLFGLIHISSVPISKFRLLNILKEKLKLKEIEIEKNTKFRCDRSLNSKKFKKISNYSPPTWEKMLEEIVLEINKR